MTFLLIISLKLIIKAFGAIIAFGFFGFMILRVESKVKRIEKKCDKLREDDRLLHKESIDCDRFILEYEVDSKSVYNKLKVQSYQIDLVGHTMYLCKAINDKSFLIVTIYGDSVLVPLNYRLEIDFLSNKVRFYGQSYQEQEKLDLQKRFSYRLLKYCEVVS